MDARTLTLALRGTWHRSYGVACCPAHEDRTPSLSLRDGNNGRLLAYCHAGCAYPDIRAALDRLGLHVEQHLSFEVCRVSLAGGTPNQDAPSKLSDAARRLWRVARPIGGTPAEAYLRGRGIIAPLPTTLRYHPACHHPLGQMLPALVALVEGAPDFAVHRTYVQADGSGKADAKPAKAMLGAVAGGAVRVMPADEDTSGVLVVAEGIETALSLASGLIQGPAPIWAALSANGIAGLHLPTPPGRLVIASDGDRVGEEAAHALAERAFAHGWNVALLPAPAGQDWNDVLRLRTSTGEAQ